MNENESGLTKQQQLQVEQFLHLFTDVERALKRRLGFTPTNPTGFRSLVQKYLDRNKYWIDRAHSLEILAEIRNLLTHSRCSTSGYPVAIAPRRLAILEEIKQELLSPRPVAEDFSTEVDCVAPSDSLQHVLELSFQKGYSQFPVVMDGLFKGLITETEITRWLGKRASENSTSVNLQTATVKTVIVERDPFNKGIPIFQFVNPSASVEEVMGIFAARPMMQVVLITENGKRAPPYQGIITQWDAARYCG